MFLVVGIILWVGVSSPAVFSAEQDEHRDFQYNSVVDSNTGRYNFAYDTGNDNEIAHSLHMQYRDANGIVRGRYGYTDPRGKLRMVEYEAGPNGFIARGDVGPDGFPHDQAPETAVMDQQPTAEAYQQDPGNDFRLNPSPVQMAGWDPVTDPMGTPVQQNGTDRAFYSGPESTGDNALGDDQYADLANATMSEGSSRELYDGYPITIFSSSDDNTGRESDNYQKAEDEVQSERMEKFPLNVYNIDVSPEEIREAGSAGPVRRSADGGTSSSPYSYRNFLRQTHDHDAEVAQASGTYATYHRGRNHDYDAEVIYGLRQTHDHGAELRYHQRPNHDHEEELKYHRRGHDHAAEVRYHQRPNHDHEAELRYHRLAHDPDSDWYHQRQNHNHDAEWYRPRQTHDHDAEKYRSRQTHDHDAEKYRSRQTHDHDAEKYRLRQTHDHDAERYRQPDDRDYSRRVYYRGRYYYPRRVYYRDSHSMEPHQHYSSLYRNYNDHQHSDAHLYGRSQNYASYPATVKPSQLKYIPADRYHDKYYYWTDSQAQ